MLSHPDTVRETHEDYIRAGSRVITTNTFGSTRQMLEPAGHGDQVETGLLADAGVDLIALEIATVLEAARSA